MQRGDVLEPVLAVGSNGVGAVNGPDLRGYPIPIECRQRVFEADSELADHPVLGIQLLWILVHGEVLYLDASSEVPDMPAVLALRNLDVGGIGDQLLVQCVGDDLTNRVVRLPVL